MEYQIQLIKPNNEISLEYTVKGSEIEEKKNRIITYKKEGGFPDIVKMRIFAKTLDTEMIF